MAITARIETSKEPTQGPDLRAGRGEQVLIQSDPRNKALVFVSDEKNPLEVGFVLQPGDQLATTRNPHDFWFACDRDAKADVRFLVN